jgi:hypothetical protein
MLKDAAKIKPQEEKTYNWYASNKILETKGGFDGKLLHGYYKCFYLSGNLRETGEFNYGLKTGKWSSWYPSGILREILYWKKGVKNGKYRLYSENGQLVAEGNFRDDKLHGKFKTYFNGKLEDVKKYRDGQEIVKKTKSEKISATKENRPLNDRFKNIFRKKTKTPSSTDQPKKEEGKKEKVKKDKKPKEKKVKESKSQKKKEQSKEVPK